jgi:nucleotide-binding universal stress UspA family protein
MKTIIVPIDFSEYSEYALKAASLLAKKDDVEIIALHMLDIQGDSLSESPIYAQERTVLLYEIAKKRFRTFLKKEYLSGIKVTPIVKHYKIFSEINEIAKEENADLIIMGSHGVSGLKEFFVGSNTEKVIRFSEIPVLVIKNDLTDFNFKDVVFATDFAKTSVDAYVRAKSIIEGFKGKMHVIYVNTPYQDFKTTSEMENLAVEFLNIAEGNIDKLKEIKFISDRSIEDGILNFANSLDADLIAVSTHGRKGLSHLFSGSISEDIANHATLPILTIKR